MKTNTQNVSTATTRTVPETIAVCTLPPTQVRNLQALVEALLVAMPSRRVLLLDVTEVRGYRLLTEANNAEVVYRVRKWLESNAELSQGLR